MLRKRGHKSILTAVIVTLVLFVAGCQCGATDTIPAPEPTSPSAPIPTTASTPPSAPTPAPAQEETVMALYENTEHGFSIEYPEGWAENVHGATTSYQFQFNEPEGSFSVGVSVDYRAEEISLADAVSEGKGYMESCPQFEMFSEGDVTISDGISAYEMIGQGDVGAGKVEKFRYVILVREKQILFVGVGGEPDQFDERETLVNAVIDSFKLLSSYTYVPPTPSPGGTYTSAEYGFSITYPAGWSDYTTGEIALDDGTPAYEVVFNGTMGGYFLTCKYVVVITEADDFLLMGFSLPGTFAQDEPVLDEVIGSFHLE